MRRSLALAITFSPSPVSLERHPEQRALICSTPDLINNAVEELLRFDTSAQVTARQETQDIKLRTTTIRKGQNVAIMIGAANRDRRRWPDADQLRLDRPNPSPISFGFGARYASAQPSPACSSELQSPPSSTNSATTASTIRT